MGTALRRLAKPYGQAVSRFVEEQRKLRVLIVDDEPPVRRTVRRLLGKECLAFLEAGDLDEAREALHCHTPPDVVVLDLALRTERADEGFGFLRDLRAQAAYTPVVVLTGRADVKIAVEAMHLGAIDVIEKGEGAERVRDAVRRALELVIANRTSKELGSVRRARSAVPHATETLDASLEENPAPPSHPSSDDLAVIFPKQQRLMKPLDHYVDEVKRQVVAEAIARSRGNLTDAARVLQMKRGNFHRLAVRLGLHEPAPTRRTPSGTQPTAALAEHPVDAASSDDDTPDSGR
ncbi:MAG: response regulator [Polyangiaceae bacterium]